MPTQPQRTRVDALHLDRRNPRLPEELQGSTESQVLHHLYENDVLEELAQSMVDNGFFEHEPLILVEEDGDSVVVEGNRRFAALAILLQLPIAREADLAFDLPRSPSTETKEALEEVPTWRARDRDDVRRFLGFRHIGGIRKWSPEAKARYLTEELSRAKESGSSEPFREVGRRVGSNAQGVRNPYIALLLLRTGREEFGIDTRWVQKERFGVWTRALNAAELRAYIGFGDPRTFEDVNAAVQSLDGERFKEVIEDLSPRGKKKAVLRDSRDVTMYAAVIANEEARAVLRRYGDLDLAAQIIIDASLPDRIQQLVDRLDIIINDVHRSPEPAALSAPTEALYSRALTLRSAVDARTQGPDA